MKMVQKVVSAIKLEEAYFCVNCELVTNCSDMCPACGRRQLWPLQKWLGRVIGCENGMNKEDRLRGIQRVHELCM